MKLINQLSDLLRELRHTAIYDDSGRYVFHAQVCKPLTIEELKEQIDFYIKLRSDNFENSLDEEAQNED